MSSVPPARSIRVGAEAWMCTGGIIHCRLAIADWACPPQIRNSIGNNRVRMRDIRRHIGQLAIVGFKGHTVPPEVRALARQFDLGGGIFFACHVERPEQVADLSRESQALAGEFPLWVSVDQEGGRV